MKPYLLKFLPFSLILLLSSTCDGPPTDEMLLAYSKKNVSYLAADELGEGLLAQKESNWQQNTLPKNLKS